MREVNGMNDFLIDTNIIIYYLNGEEIVVRWINQYREHLFLSVISKIEVLSFPYNQEEEEVVSQFLDQFILLNLNENIVNQTIQIRRSHRRKTPDAIIAATAITENLVLCTRNIRDFINLELFLINPFDEL